LKAQREIGLYINIDQLSLQEIADTLIKNTIAEWFKTSHFLVKLDCMVWIGFSWIWLILTKILSG